ncbi:MAG: hypothetical protein KatS3mg024_2498 [Armatimonadota bacterium]|nr:MAG: hypothetical protein KatS3mg024_2498 [Armatimonadota bacterium]
MTPDLSLAAVLLILAAALVWAGVARAAVSLISTLRDEWLIAANPSGEESRLAVLDRRVRELADSLARLERQMSRQAEESAASLKSAIEDLRASFYKTLHDSFDAESAPLRERLDTLEHAMDQARSQLEVASRIEHLAETLAKSQQVVRKLAEQTVREHSRAAEAQASEAVERAVSRLEERLAGMEQMVREGLLAAAKAEDVIALGREVEDIRSRSEEAAAGGAASAEEHAGLLEERITHLSEELDSLRRRVSGQEPFPSGERINAGSPPVAAEEIPVREPQIAPGTSRRPRIVSARARERFEEVLRLSGQGLTVEAIAVRTGLDIAEIELMIAGQPPQEGPEVQ